MQIVNRRQVVSGLGVLALGGAASGSFSAFARNTRPDPVIRFGAQTNAWAINPNDFSTFLDVLSQIHTVGYSGFETGFANVIHQFDDARTARKQIESKGLIFFGVHIYLPHQLYDPATNLPPASLYQKIADGGAALGARHLIFSAAPAENDADLARKIAGLNAAGKYSRSVGLTLAYHNETAQESQSKLGELEALYDRTDPEYVSFLLDCGHAYQGGANVPAFLHKHYGRIVGLHLRDYKDGRQVVLGEGTFPLAETAKVLEQARWKGWVLNEEERLDGSKHGLEYIEPAFKAAKEAFSV